MREKRISGITVYRYHGIKTRTIRYHGITRRGFRYSGITVSRDPEKEQICRKISPRPSCGARKAFESGDNEAVPRHFPHKNRIKPLATSRKRLKRQKYRTFCAKYLHVSEKCSNFVRFFEKYRYTGIPVSRNIINHEILGIPVYRYHGIPKTHKTLC